MINREVQCKDGCILARTNPQTLTLVMATVGQQKTGGGFAVGVGFQGELWDLSGYIMGFSFYNLFNILKKGHFKSTF